MEDSVKIKKVQKRFRAFRLLLTLRWTRRNAERCREILRTTQENAEKKASFSFCLIEEPKKSRTATNKRHTMESRHFLNFK